MRGEDKKRKKKRSEGEKEVKRVNAERRREDTE